MTDESDDIDLNARLRAPAEDGSDLVESPRQLWTQTVASKLALEPINYELVDDLETACFIEQVNANSLKARSTNWNGNQPGNVCLPYFDNKPGNEAILKVWQDGYQTGDLRAFFKKNNIAFEYHNYQDPARDLSSGWGEFVISDLTSQRKVAAAGFWFPGSDVLRCQENFVAASRGQSLGQGQGIT